MSNQETARNHPWTILKLLNWAASYFHSHQIDSPKSTAEILLSHALGLKRIDLYLQYDRPLNRDELAAFKQLVLRRQKREPVAYIVGEKEFWSLPLTVGKEVLIPRPDTECLVEVALGVLKQARPSGPWRILELGTGSGAVALALASEQPDHFYVASDISPGATLLARRNAEKNGIANVHFFAGNWLAPLRKSERWFDMIVSNPPYIPSGDIPGLQPEILRYEPLAALDAGADGLICLRHLIRDARHYLKTGGYLVLEIGFDQKKQVVALAETSGHYEAVSVHKDYGGNDRVVCMRRV